MNIVSAVVHRTYRIVSADRVAVIKDGRCVDEMSPEEMIANAQAMIQQARRAMEMRPKAAEKLAFDSAILLRNGFPVGLSSNPQIMGMARVEAESNRDLRRFMPGGIKSSEQCGTPSVRNVKE